jgi:hypothetical protein
MLSIHPSLVERFRQTLLADGFTSAGIFQVWKKGQVFGYIRRLRHDVEWHVRAYADGRLESELEPHETQSGTYLSIPTNQMAC